MTLGLNFRCFNNATVGLIIPLKNASQRLNCLIGFYESTVNVDLSCLLQEEETGAGKETQSATVKVNSDLDVCTGH